jgi:hypothetical protein
LEPDPDRWDINKICKILVAFVDEEPFKNDFEINGLHENTSKLKQRIRDIKMLRNKVSHSGELEAREIYEQVDNIQRFFETFKSGCPNSISINKDSLVWNLNVRRLLALS